MISITFLLDKTNNWIKTYVEDFISIYKKDKFNFNISFNHENIQNNEIVFILGYTKILDEEFLNFNKLNLVVHESDLPKGKGFSPVQWQVLEGKNQIVVTLFEATKKIDAGDIYLQETIELSGYELFDEIRDIQGKKTIILIENFLNSYPNVLGKKQIGKETIYPRRTKNDDKLDIEKSIQEQFNHLRVANNDEYPLWFEIDGQKYIIKIYKDKNEK